MSSAALIEFSAWPKTPHWFRDITVTEKLDGTNGAIGIVQYTLGTNLDAVDPNENKAVFVFGDDNPETGLPDHEYHVYAQSRKRLITPDDDNHGFAAWVWANARTLVNDLGPGRHFGEWWGQGIQRNYDMDHKRFSLFNTKKWYAEEFSTPKLDVVPVLYEGELEFFDVEAQLDDLRDDGSYAAEGFMNPEGIVLYHHHANQVFKIRLEDRPAVDPPEIASISGLFSHQRFSLFGNLFRGDRAA